MHEEDISAKCAAAKEDARLPGADEDSRRTKGPEASAREGTQATHGLERAVGPRTGRTPTRATRLRGRQFQAMFQQGSRREERPAFIALWRPGRGPAQVGFAVGRRIGGAVDRNRIRRRLREAYRRSRSADAENFDAVFVGKSTALTRPFDKLLEDMRETIAILAAAGPRRAGERTRS